MRQTDYGYNQPLGIPGGIFDLGGKRIVTRTIDEDVAVKPGMGLVQGATAGETVALPDSSATADVFEGILVHGSVNLEHDMDGVVQADNCQAIGAMQHGRIWASIVETATVAYGSSVALITDGDNVGKFTDADDSSEATKVTIDAKFIGKVDTDNLIAVVEL
ncbi:MAG: hypothetical protein LUC83_01285 [Clostridiales bacterium]|nr:hypothetical protein [Clostridiales bacterium]